MVDENEKNRQSYLHRVQRIIHRIEDGILVALLLLLIGLAVSQIVLRNLLGGAIVWGDVVVRVLVLWIGLFGAMSGSRNGDHIHIDLVTRYLPDRIKSVSSFVVHLSAALICLTVAWYGCRFVQMEFQSQTRLFANVPAWICELIIPFGFAVIGLRYGLLAFQIRPFLWKSIKNESKEHT